jgi:hypothetical protein
MGGCGRMFGHAKDNTLTSAEISGLWFQYQGDSMAICLYKHFLHIVEDKKIKPILEMALHLAETHLTKITEYLEKGHFQIPKGFTKKDVNLTAPRLCSDEFTLFYTYIMTIHGLTAYGLAITNAERKEIQDYFFECTASSKELFQKIVTLAKTRNIFSVVPTVPSPGGVEFNRINRHI